MAATTDQFSARLRKLEELSQMLVLLLENQTNNGNDDSRCSMALNIANFEPPFFVGKEDPLQLEDWLHHMEKIFDVCGTPEVQKVDQAAFYLRESADRWWETQRPIISTRPEFNWSAFKVAMKDRFFPEYMRRQKCSEFNRFNQGKNMSVREYTHKFYEYAILCPDLVPNEAAKVQKFEYGLLSKIQMWLGGSSSSTLTEAYDKACNIEMILEEEEKVLGRNRRKVQDDNVESQFNGKRFRFGNNNGDGGNIQGRGYSNIKHQNQNKNDDQSRNNYQNTWICKKFGKRHLSYTCQDGLIKCYACGEHGHKAKQCLKNQDDNTQELNGYNGNHGGGYRNNNRSNNGYYQGGNSQAGNGAHNNNHLKGNQGDNIDGFYQGSAQSDQQSNPQSTEHYSAPKPLSTSLSAIPSRSNSSTPPQPLSTNGSGGFWSNGSGRENSIPPSAHGIVIGSSSTSFTYEELSVATDGFSSNNLLGQGGFGYVHKGILPNGKTVAVKSLKAGSGQGDREFQAEVETISRVHHKHLVSLVGYCITGPQKLLVYEFLPNKTMEFHLHGKGQPVMDWPTRLRIAVGAGKGLAYLHEDCHPKIIHRDIKAANILLDFKFEAQVADFGLAKFTSDAETHVSTRVMGTFGYLAPEYANSGKLTEKSDVFSYGVMLLEFITGRRPVDYSPEAQMEDSLVDWARPLLSKAVQDGFFDPLVDPRLENNYNYEEMGAMITCAASCVRHSARRRPRMSQVVRALEGNLSLSEVNDGVRPGFSSAHGSSDLDSGTDKEEVKKFRKLAFLSEDYSGSDFRRTPSEFSDGLSSGEMRRKT